MLQTFKAPNVVCKFLGFFLLSYEITVGQGWESPYEVVRITVLIKSWHVTSVQAYNPDDPHQNWSQTRISSSQTKSKWMWKDYILLPYSQCQHAVLLKLRLSLNLQVLMLYNAVNFTSYSWNQSFWINKSYTQIFLFLLANAALIQWLPAKIRSWYFHKDLFPFPLFSSHLKSSSDTDKAWHHPRKYIQHSAAKHLWWFNSKVVFGERLTFQWVKSTLLYLRDLYWIYRLVLLPVVILRSEKSLGLWHTDCQSDASLTLITLMTFTEQIWDKQKTGLCLLGEKKCCALVWESISFKLYDILFYFATHLYI